MSYTKLCSVYVQFKRANQSSSPSKIRQSINVEWCTCDRNGNNSFSEIKKNFGCLIKQETF